MRRNFIIFIMYVTLTKEPCIEQCKIGFSWTTFFFGFLVPLFRGDAKWFFVMFFISIVTSGIGSFVLAFFYNQIYIKDLINKGWKPYSKNDEMILKTWYS